MYYIIRKLHVVDDQVTYTSIGYVTNPDDVNKCLDLPMLENLRIWLETNMMGLMGGTIRASDFISLAGIDHTYVSDIITDNIDGQGLLEITDFDNIERV